MKKKDGHTHTEYCLHGSREKTELFVNQAINLGFETYTFTEHMPLPNIFFDKSPYAEEVLRNKICMHSNDMDTDCYIQDMIKLKKKYENQIELLVGFEVDYIPENETWIRSMLREYDGFLDEIILSVHFIQGKDGWRCPAYDISDFEENILDFYDSSSKVQLEYYRLIRDSVQLNLGFNKKVRIGHMSYCNKFTNAFPNNNEYASDILSCIDEILKDIKEKNYEIDINVSGLFHNYYRDTHPPIKIIQKALIKGIPLIYGSDSHSVKDVGRAYDYYNSLVGK
jgi:histidinol-phosphatase (PHP family)